MFFKGKHTRMLPKMEKHFKHCLEKLFFPLELTILIPMVHSLSQCFMHINSSNTLSN